MKKTLLFVAVGSVALAFSPTSALAGTSVAAGSGAGVASTPSQAIQLSADATAAATKPLCGYPTNRSHLHIEPARQTVIQGHGTTVKTRLGCNGHPVPGQKVFLNVTPGNGGCPDLTNAHGATFCRVSRVTQDEKVTAHTNNPYQATSDTVKIFVR